MTPDLDDLPTVVVHDQAERSLLCTVEQALTLHGQSYALLSPVATPVTLFIWEEAEDAGDQAEEEPVVIESEAEIETLFPIAKAVLAEQNLELIWSAVTLTVEGELPDLTLDDEDELETHEGNGADPGNFEEFHLLASFYHEEQEYAVYLPLEPYYILARMEQGKPVLLGDEEYDQISEAFETELAKLLEAEE
ncbi:MAG: DUF3727 domain-containing protein [Cyanobacteria bacterium P01_H01_bin.121]